MKSIYGVTQTHINITGKAAKYLAGIDPLTIIEHKLDAGEDENGRALYEYRYTIKEPEWNVTEPITEAELIRLLEAAYDADHEYKITVTRTPDECHAYTLYTASDCAYHTAIETAGDPIFEDDDGFDESLAEIMNDDARVEDTIELDDIPSERIREYFAEIIREAE